MKTKKFAFLIGLAPLLVANALGHGNTRSQAPDNKGVTLPPVATAPAAPAPRAPDYRASYDATTRDLQEVDSLLQKRLYQQALVQAKTVLQNIQAVLGIQPRTPKIITLDASLINDDVLTKSFDELPTQVRIMISNVVQSQMQAQYLNLLNAAKRASIQYVKASYLQRNESTKDLDKRDIEYFRQLVLDAHDVKIFIQDPQARGLFIAFDSEFADPITQYEFNKELQQFALSITQLGYTEDSFEKALIDHRAAQRANHISQLPRPTPPAKAKPSSAPFYGKFSASKIETSADGLITIFDPAYNGAPLGIEGLNGKFRPTYGSHTSIDYIALVCAGFGYSSSAMVDGSRFQAWGSEIPMVMQLATEAFDGRDDSRARSGIPVNKLFCRD